MNNIPKRRQGIDGLSHRPARVHIPTDATHTPKIAPAQGNQPTSSHTEIAGFELQTGVSHPSLPQRHSRIQDRPESSIRKLLKYPLCYGRDRHVALLGVVSMVLDVRFWILVCLPPFLARLYQAGNQSPAELSQAINRLLVARNYVWAIVIIGGAYIALVVSVLVTRTTRQVLMATTIRRIDHRVGRTHILVRHVVSNIGKTTISSLVDALLLTLVIISSGALLYYVTISSPSWLLPWRSYVAGLVGVIAITVGGIIATRRHLQQAMLSTTRLPVASIQLRSFKLVKRNFAICTVALCTSLLELLLALFAMLAVGVWLNGILPKLTTIPGRLSAWLLSLLVVGLLWLATVLWQAIHWAGLYHLVVLRTKKDEVSDYLVPSEHLKFRLRPVLAVAAVALVGLLVFVSCSVAFSKPILNVGSKVKSAIPVDVGKFVPGIEDK